MDKTVIFLSKLLIFRNEQKKTKYRELELFRIEKGELRNRQIAILKDLFKILR